MKIKAFLIDVIGGNSRVVEIENKLEDYYRELHCELIDIQSRKVGKKVFDIICDDEGLMKEDNKISAIDNLGAPMFVGNLLVVNCKDGVETGLEDDEIEYVRDRVQKLCTRNFPEGYEMLTQVEYC